METFILSSIHFSSEDQGYAVGSLGMIVKYTNDSGWHVLKKQTDKQLNKVYFLNNSIGWISGGYFSSGTSELIFMKTRDGGINWNIQTDMEYEILDICFKDGNRGWAVGMDTSYHGLILSTEDGGEHWEKMAENFPAPLRSIFFDDRFGWAVGGMGLILRTDNGVTWIDNEGNNVSKMDFQLDQNFPNPFNPKTVIRYSVGAIHESPVHVDLSIYNILGQKVATLVNKNQTAGSYQMEWDASNFTSGVYLYRLQAGTHVETRKMILMR